MIIYIFTWTYLFFPYGIALGLLIFLINCLNLETEVLLSGSKTADVATTDETTVGKLWSNMKLIE
jgi:hypothetical protein